jgi:predicted O-linked N-acetylglucosamine transferase (SPINDLY family)
MESFETARQHFLAGRFAQAEAICRQILAAEPRHPSALCLLGQLAHRVGRSDLAAQLIGQSIQFQPQNADAHQELGNALMACGRIEEAIEAFRGAIGVRKDFAEAHCNLGVALGLQSRFEESIEAFGRAIALQPDFPEAHDGLGIVLRASDQAEAAVASHRRAIQLRPDFAAAHSNLGLALERLGLIDQSIAEFRRALRIDPGFRSALTNLIYTLNFQPGCDPQVIYKEHVAWNRTYAQPLAHLAQPHANTADPERRLRVGYVSADFRQHSVSYFIENLLAKHDMEQVEIFCYVDLVKPDATTDRLRKLVANWRDITGRDYGDVSQLIREDQIDILVDLAGHTGGNRLLVFATRPAPVQVTYLGYFTTTGMDAVDYRITDEYADPPGMTERFYSEQLLRLPQTFASYSPPAGAPPVGPLPALANGYVTFGSFNILQKISQPLLERWGTVLSKVRGSRLIMVASGLRYPGVEQRIVALFQRRGVERERLMLLDKLSFEEYMAIHQRVDVILDSFPVNGHTVTCHGLWMGVPAVCLAGSAYCQRLGISVMSNLGLSELVAQAPREYVEIAVKLANDLPRLSELRATMRERMSQSPLMDDRRFAGQVENAYRTMWRHWCDTGQAKSHETTTDDVAIQRLLVQARLCFDAGRLPEAEGLCRKIVAIKPRDPGTLHLMGCLAHRGRRPDIAVDLIKQSIDLKPDNAEAHLDLADAMVTLNRLEEAAGASETAVALDPRNARAHFTLGTVRLLGGEIDRAVTALDEAIKLDPDFADAHSNLANAMVAQGHIAAAIGHFGRCRDLQPSSPQANRNLGGALAAGGQFDEAIAAFDETLRLKPDFAEAQNSLGSTLKKMGQVDEAIAAFRKAIRLKPDYTEAHSNLIFALLFHPGSDAEMIGEELRRWNQQHAAPLRRFIQPHTNNRDPDRKLRIGYVSADFRTHSVSQFLLPLFREQDHGACEIICYSDVLKIDGMTDRLRVCTDGWQNIVGWTDERVADKVREDQIDILVDLTGHTGSNRLLVFARKRAPIQVSYLGYPGTTGLSEMDYRLTDAFADPPGKTELLDGEKLLRLPVCNWCFSEPDDAPPVGPLPAESVGSIRFGTFNNFAKASPAIMDLWAAILIAMPLSRLIIKSLGLGEKSVRERIHRHFAARGVQADRLEIRGREPKVVSHLDAYNQMDIALDTFPYHGTTTTCESLWMGVPVVTLAGTTHVSRVGVSLLNNVGLPELIAQTPQEYVEIAVNLAKDLPRLAELRRILRSRMQASPLMDAPRFARDIEAAYRQIWRSWCAGRAK